METKKTDAVVEVADNGYILRYGDTVLVYTNTNNMGNGYRDMIADIMSDLDNAIEEGECSKIRVHVEVEPLNYNEHGQAQ